MTSESKTELLPRPRVTSQDVTAHTVPTLLRRIKQDAERGSVFLEEWGRPAQEAYLGQPRTMGSWRVYLFCILLCAMGQFYSYAQIQTEEYKTKYLPYFSTAEDSNEKQLVSCTSCLLDQLKCFQNVWKVVDPNVWWIVYFRLMQIFIVWELFLRLFKWFNSWLPDQQLTRCFGKASKQSPSNS